MANGYGEKRVAWEKKRKRRGKKKKEKKRAGLVRKDKTQTWAPQYEYIYKNAIVTLFL